MRVLQLIDSLPLAGAEVLVKDVAPRLRKRGVECEVAVLRRLHSPLESSLEEEGILVHGDAMKRIYSPRQVRPLAKLMPQFDVIHVHLFPAQLWAVLADIRLRKSVPLVTTEHGASNFRRRWWLRFFDRWMYSRYLCIACNSSATAEGLIRWCPSAAPRVRVIQNGIPTNDFENAEPVDLGVPPNIPRLVFVGRFEPPKDHATVLRALAVIPNAHLFLVGDGVLRPNLEKLARTLGIADRVTFLGRRRDVAQILKASDIYIHSTTFDGFGIAACEAMASGLPVVASDVPGLADVVRGAGVLFPVGDHTALAREIRELLGSSQRQRELRKASRERAQDFGIDRTVDGYLSMYESVLECKNQVETVVR